MSSPTAITLLLAALAAARPAAAQLLPDHVPSAASVPAGPADPVQDAARYREDPGGAALGAIVLGAIGFVGLGYAGVALADCDQSYDDMCGLGSFIGAGLMGEALGIGLGAHIGNRRRGNVVAPLGASVGLLLVALAAGDEVNLPEGAVLLVPLAQIVAAVWAETATARSRAGR
jgi:hypothetical protein